MDCQKFKHTEINVQDLRLYADLKKNVKEKKYKSSIIYIYNNR